MLPPMKPLLPLAAFAILVCAGCGEDRGPTHAETRDSFNHAGGQSDQSYDKENPANPGQFSGDKKP